MYDIEISRFAYNEIEESKDYYNLKKHSLGLDFKRDVFTAINSIASYPTLYPIIIIEKRFPIKLGKKVVDSPRDRPFSRHPRT